jgi:hypothetical protein
MIEVRLRNHYCRGKAKSITYSEYVFVVVLIIQQAKRVSHILLSSMAYMFRLCFSTLSHKRHDYGGMGGGY